MTEFNGLTLSRNRSDCFSQYMDEWSPEICQRYVDSLRERFHPKLKSTLNFLLAILVDKLMKNSWLTLNQHALTKIILRNGGDPMFRDRYGETLAYKVLKSADIKTIRIFLHHLEDINAPLNFYGKRAIHIICECHHESFLPLVLCHNPDLNVQDNMRFTPVHIVVKRGNSISTKMLVDAGADLNIPDTMGNTPLHTASALPTGDESIITFVTNVFNVKVKNNNGDTPLHLLLTANRTCVVDLMQQLLDMGANPSETNNFGLTPLHVIIKHNYFFPVASTRIIVEKLISHGAAINALDIWGNSVLHLQGAFDISHDMAPDLLKLLLESGADPNKVNLASRTVIDYYDERRSRHGKYLIKYLVTNSFRNEFQFGRSLLRSIESSEIFAEYFSSCLKELSSLQRSKFKSTKSFTLVDVLTESSISELVRYVRNKQLVDMMSTFDTQKYTVFGEDLKKKYKQGFDILDSKNKTIEFFLELSGGTLNLQCVENIVGFLPMEEIHRIAFTNEDRPFWEFCQISYD